jgi:hypothetical protein
MSIDKVVAAALAEVGYQEGVNNDNKFAKVAGHANHQAWCATFVRACLIKGEEEKAIPNTAYCPYIEAWARANHAVVPLAESRKGDLVLFDFSRAGRAEHIGIQLYDFNPKSPHRITTVDGNSTSISSNNRNQQANGGGVVKKTRDTSLVRVIVRPKYKENK